MRSWDIADGCLEGIGELEGMADNSFEDSLVVGVLLGDVCQTMRFLECRKKRIRLNDMAT